MVARDRHGNECRRGGERLTVQCCGPTHPIISSADRGDGTYRVGVRYGLSGEYELSVRVGKATIGGSPFKVHVGLRSMEAAVATWRQRFARREAAVVAKVFDAWRQFVGHRAVSRRLERRASIVGLEGADWLERPPVEGGDASLEALRGMGLAA